MNQENNEKDTELSQLIIDLEKLQLQVNVITRRIKDLQGNTNNKNLTKSRGLTIGDKVVVTSN